MGASSRLLGSLKRTGQRLIQEEDGAEIIEFLGMLPFLFLVITIFMQVFAFGLTGVAAMGAAHAGARAAAIHGCGAASGAAAEASARWGSGRSVSCSGCGYGSACNVEVRLRVPVMMGGVDIEFPASAAMRREPRD